MVHPHACDSENQISHVSITLICQVTVFGVQGSQAETHIWWPECLVS